jgi:hypothetical protein
MVLIRMKITKKDVQDFFDGSCYKYSMMADVFKYLEEHNEDNLIMKLFELSLEKKNLQYCVEHLLPYSNDRNHYFELLNTVIINSFKGNFNYDFFSNIFIMFDVLLGIEVDDDGICAPGDDQLVFKVLENWIPHYESDILRSKNGYMKILEICSLGLNNEIYHKYIVEPIFNVLLNHDSSSTGSYDLESIIDAVSSNKYLGPTKFVEYICENYDFVFTQQIVISIINNLTLS